MSTDDTSSDHGFFVRKGHHGPLHHAAGRTPKAALAALDALHLCDGDCVWIWRAASVRSDIENSSVGALGPVGDPRVFEVRIGLIELNEGFSDPEVMLKEMLAESEKTDAPSYPRAPNISSCRYSVRRDAFMVSFENHHTQILHRSCVKRVDGMQIPLDAVSDCKVDEFRRGVLVKLADGSETSFSANLVLYETDPDFRAQALAASRVPNASVQGIVHVLGPRGRMLCGAGSVSEPGDWNEEDAWCSAEDAQRRATCPACRTRAGLTEVTQSGQLATSELEHCERESVTCAERRRVVAHGLVHVMVDGGSVCGYEGARLPARDAGCSAAEADRLATCHPCLAGWAARRTSGERTLVPAGDGRVVCPGCEKVRPEFDADLPRERWQPMLDAYLPCCNPECGGQRETGCWHCHHPKFWDEQPGRRAQREQIEVLTSHGVTGAAATVQVRTLGGDARVPTKAWYAGSEDGRVFCFYADGTHQVYASLDDARGAHPGTEWEVASLTAPLSKLPRQPLSVSHRSFGPGETPEINAVVYSEASPAEVVEALREQGVEVTDPAQPDTSEEHHTGRGSRIEREIRGTMDMSDTQLRALMRVTVGAIWDAVEDLDGITEGLHPADIVQKYLQRGNIRKDGQW